MLDIKQAERLAREYVGTSAVLAPYDARPKGIYWLEGAEEHLFAVRRQGRHYVGATRSSPSIRPPASCARLGTRASEAFGPMAVARPGRAQRKAKRG